jgi:CRP-like cAMP-binding protein
MKISDLKMAHRAGTQSALLSLFEKNPFQKICQPDTTILLDGHAADTVYMVVCGTLRCCTISEEGSRQIFRFVRKGEFVGVCDIDTWHFTAEAVDHVTLKSIPRACLEQELAVNGALREELRAHLCHQLHCREQQLLSVMTSNASDRLLQFLRDFASGRPPFGYVVLPMCRRDIADHLGMSPETVSRAFGSLKASGYIDLRTPEKYALLDRGAARAVA